MKVLYGVQATGNGHISRAIEILPKLQKRVDLDILISGTQGDLKLPFEPKYKCHGFSYIFGVNGGISYFDTLRNLNHKRLIREVQELPIKKYDLVINDFEPISAWASRLNDVPSVALSHQAALLSPHVPKPSKVDLLHHLVLSQYAPTSSAVGFHFERYDTNIFTPVIRGAIRKLETRREGHYTVYLPSYHHYKIINVLRDMTDVDWHIFSKHATRVSSYGSNIKVYPVENGTFLKSLVNAEGIICGAGFETPAEALYLKKKLLVIPMKGQFEQQYNAKALKQLGVPVIRHFRKSEDSKIADWISSSNRLSVQYPDITEEILDLILERAKSNLLEV